MCKSLFFEDYFPIHLSNYSIFLVQEFFQKIVLDVLKIGIHLIQHLCLMIFIGVYMFHHVVMLFMLPVGQSKFHLERKYLSLNFNFEISLFSVNEIRVITSSVFFRSVLGIHQILIVQTQYMLK